MKWPIIVSLCSMLHGNFRSLTNTFSNMMQSSGESSSQRPAVSNHYTNFDLKTFASNVPAIGSSSTANAPRSGINYASLGSSSASGNVSGLVLNGQMPLECFGANNSKNNERSVNSSSDDESESTASDDEEGIENKGRSSEPSTVKNTPSSGVHVIQTGKHATSTTTIIGAGSTCTQYNYPRRRSDKTVKKKRRKLPKKRSGKSSSKSAQESETGQTGEHGSFTSSSTRLLKGNHTQSFGSYTTSSFGVIKQNAVSLTLAAHAKVSIEEIQAASLTISLDSYAKLYIGKSLVTHLSATTGSNATLSIDNGVVTKLSATVGSYGELKSQGVCCDKGSVSIGSWGTACVWIKALHELKVGSYGVLKYKGNPTIKNQQLSSSAEMKQIK